MKLAQAIYKNADGYDISASVVQKLASVEFGVDGFYSWWCGNCDECHASRACGWPITGQVLQCHKCKTMNLLVRTDTDFVLGLGKKKWESEERDKECARLQGIEKYNEDQIRKIRWDFLTKVKEALGLP